MRFVTTPSNVRVAVVGCGAWGRNLVRNFAELDEPGSPELANVVLRMSVGVHSGAYTLFVVGGSHREMLIGGPAASTVITLEAAASSGQILISADTAGQLPRSALGIEWARASSWPDHPRPVSGRPRPGFPLRRVK